MLAVWSPRAAPHQLPPHVSPLLVPEVQTLACMGNTAGSRVIVHLFFAVSSLSSSQIPDLVTALVAGSAGQ